MIYLDNAATSWPKPDCVTEAIVRYLRDIGGSPGRSGHQLANAAERLRLDAREALAELFGLANPLRVVFTSGATAALNLVLRGLLGPGSHVVTSGIEHNAVMRPLRALETQGVEVGIAACAPDGTLAPAAVAEQLRPQTRLIVVNHASNVCGTLLPIRAIGALARERGIAFVVDAAQTAGCQPIDLEADNIDVLVFSGHKGLLGPTGVGGLAFSPRFDVGRLPAAVFGGTGSRSEDEHQPDFLPDKYEAGTPNIVGIAGLAASVRYVLARGVSAIRAHEQRLTRRLLDGLGTIGQVRLFGPPTASARTAVVSFTLAGWSSSQLAQQLDERFGILCRPGLHCAPRAHRTLGTFPDGTVRFAPGPFTTEEQIDAAVAAVARLARGQ